MGERDVLDLDLTLEQRREGQRHLDPRAILTSSGRENPVLSPG